MSIDFNGSWINQLSSILELTVNDAGQIEGTFTSNRGRAAKDKHCPVVGMANGELVSLVADYRDPEENLHAVSSWVGRYIVDPQGLEQIHTLWVLGRQFDDEAMTRPTKVWNTFLVNSDVFTKYRT